MTDNIREMQKNTLIMNHINDGLIIPTASINELWENNVKQWLLIAPVLAIKSHCFTLFSQSSLILAVGIIKPSLI